MMTEPSFLSSIFMSPPLNLIVVDLDFMNLFLIAKVPIAQAQLPQDNVSPAPLS